jgi:hypothetical protein
VSPEPAVQQQQQQAGTAATAAAGLSGLPPLPPSAVSAEEVTPAAAAASAMTGTDSEASGSAAAAGGLFPVTVRESALPDSIRELLSAHLDFLRTTGQLSVRDMMGPLREYAQVQANAILWGNTARHHQ